jgi:hypothetical protein
VAVANIAFAIVGSVNLLFDFRSVVSTGMLTTKNEFHVFYVMITWNVLMAAFLLAGSRLLLRSHAVASPFCTMIFVAELVYCATIVIFWVALPGKSGGVIAAVSNVGNPVIIPQLWTGYPLIALALLRLASHKSIIQ